MKLSGGFFLLPPPTVILSYSLLRTVVLMFPFFVTQKASRLGGSPYAHGCMVSGPQHFKGWRDFPLQGVGFLLALRTYLRQSCFLTASNARLPRYSRLSPSLSGFFSVFVVLGMAGKTTNNFVWGLAGLFI